MTVSIPPELHWESALDEIKFLISRPISEEEIRLHYTHSLFFPSPISQFTGRVKQFHTEAVRSWLAAGLQKGLGPNDDDWRAMSSGRAIPLWVAIRYMRVMKSFEQDRKKFALLLSYPGFADFLEKYAIPKKGSITPSTTYFYPDQLKKMREANGLSEDEASREFQIKDWHNLESISLGKSTIVTCMKEAKAKEIFDKLVGKTPLTSSKSPISQNHCFSSVSGLPHGRNVRYRAASNS